MSDIPKPIALQPELKPTKAELRALGVEIMDTLRPLFSKYPNLQTVVSFGLPREGAPDKLALTTVANDMPPMLMLTMLVTGAKDVKEQMIDPFYIDNGPKD